MKILSINAGSSSVKFSLFDNGHIKQAWGMIERIGMEGTRLVYQANNNRAADKAVLVPDMGDAVRNVLDILLDNTSGVISDPSEINAVGHRVVHGGEHLVKPTRITPEILIKIEECSRLAPLHNPSNLEAIKVCMENLPMADQIAIFDTAFHAGLPEKAYLYAIPHELYKKEGIRRYGFHGISHQYVSRRAADLMEDRLEELRLIVCHLGNGCSISAVKNGHSVDTSMGFTPLEGLVMGTRCGDIDPAIIWYLKNNKGFSDEETHRLLNQKSGLYGLAGMGTSDLRDIEIAAKDGNVLAETAIAVFVYRIQKYIGAYLAVLGGADGLIFTAGIGENSPGIRERICMGLINIGIRIDPRKNTANGNGTPFIHHTDSPVKILVVKTDEEAEIARQTLDVIQGE